MPNFEHPPSQPTVDITEQLAMTPGERISAVMLRAKALQREMGCAVQFLFNMQAITIHPEPTVDEKSPSHDARIQPKEDR